MSLIALFLAAATPGAAVTPPAPQIVTTRTGVRIETLQPGTGRHPTKDDAVRLLYEVRLADGTLVEAPEGPAGLRVAGVISGLTEALLLMQKGGRYRVGIPAKQAYGKRGNADGSVPPNTDLVFTITLLQIGREAPRPRR